MSYHTGFKKNVDERVTGITCFVPYTSLDAAVQRLWIGFEQGKFTPYITLIYINNRKPSIHFMLGAAGQFNFAHLISGPNGYNMYFLCAI